MSWISFTFISRFLFFICFIFAAGQAQGQTGKVTNADEVVLSTSDRTYVSFGQGFGSYETPYSKTDLNPLIFEGQISPDFVMNLSKKRTLGFAFFPKIVVRMFNENSLPVKTPSYMPSLLFYHSIRSPFSKKLFPRILSEDQVAFLTYRLLHHSNGQNGTYFI